MDNTIGYLKKFVEMEGIEPSSGEGIKTAFYMFILVFNLADLPATRQASTSASL